MKYIVFILSFLIGQMTFSQTYYLLAGTYTKTNSKGIYVYRFDSKSGQATLVGTTSADNPSYLAFDKDSSHVYAVNELIGGKGSLSSFSFDNKTGSLKLINKQLTNGDDPCYVSIDHTNKWAVTANYSGGNFTLFPVKDDGSIGIASQTIQHTGSGPDKDTQEKAHVHSTLFSPDNHHLVVADLGLNNITIYPFDAAKEEPVTNEPITLNAPPGSGARHIVFHPSKQFAYLIGERSGNITAYDYSGNDIDSIQTVSSLPADYRGDRESAAIHFSADGKFLYGSNRGESNTISIFSVDETTGRLTSLGFQSTGGNHPRDFMIDPTGKYLLTANMNSGYITVMNRDAKTGLLKDSGRKISIPQPTYLLFTHIK